MRSFLTRTLLSISVLAFVFGTLSCEEAKSSGKKKYADLTELNAKITEAQALVDGTIVNTSAAEVPVGQKWVTPEDKEALEAAITKAQALVDSKPTKSTHVLNAVVELQAAIDAFTAALKDGTKQDSTPPQIRLCY